MKRVVVVAAIAAVVLLARIQIVSAVDGKAVYDKNCSACHNNMPPKLGDKIAWVSRCAKGVDVLTQSVVKGKGIMPPRGGNVALTDAEIKAATEHIMSKSCN